MTIENLNTTKPARPEIRSLFNLCELLPRGRITGGEVDLTELADHTAETLGRRCYEVKSNGIAAVRAIGEALYWLNTLEDPPPNNVTGDLGEVVQLIADAIEAADLVEARLEWRQSRKDRRP